MRNLIVQGPPALGRGLDPRQGDRVDAGDPRVHPRAVPQLLGREPNAYELEVFVAEWTSEPAVGPRTIIRAIIGSREYQSQ